VPLLIHRLLLLLAIGWALVIFLLSSQPGTDIPPLISGQDKLLHVLIFGIFGFLVLGSLPAAASGYTTYQAAMALTVVTVYGVLDEIHQRYVPGRSADVFDVVADIAGGMLGIALLYLLINRRLRSRHR
jgi:VanZ family protein